MHNVTPAGIIFKEGNEQLPPAEHSKWAVPGSLPVIQEGYKPTKSNCRPNSETVEIHVVKR